MTARLSSVDNGKTPLNLCFVGVLKVEKAKGRSFSSVVLNSDYTGMFSEVFSEVMYINSRCSVRNMNKVIIEHVRYLLFFTHDSAILS